MFFYTGAHETQSAVAALSPARCVLSRARLPPPASRPAACPVHRMCPACDPRQEARAFNQPLSWNTSLVTDMHYMFTVRSSSRPASPICTHAPSTLRAACAPRSCPYIYMLLAPQLSAHRTPPLRMCPSYALAGSRGWPAHLRKPQPTSNQSPRSLSVGCQALSS